MVKILIQVLPRIGLLATHISFTDQEQSIKLVILFILPVHNNNLGVDWLNEQRIRDSLLLCDSWFPIPNLSSFK